MTIGSIEHYAMLEGFEKYVAKTPIRTRFDKEPKADWSKGRIYQDMSTNDLFNLYAAGYANARWGGSWPNGRRSAADASKTCPPEHSPAASARHK